MNCAQDHVVSFIFSICLAYIRLLLNLRNHWIFLGFRSATLKQGHKGAQIENQYSLDYVRHRQSIQ